MEYLETVYNFFKRRPSVFLDEKGKPLKIGLCYDSRREHNWVGVVLRNLPAKADQAGVIKKLSEVSKIKIITCSKVVAVKERNCAVVRVSDIEDAEKLCFALRN